MNNCYFTEVPLTFIYVFNVHHHKYLYGFCMHPTYSKNYYEDAASRALECSSVFSQHTEHYRSQGSSQGQKA